MHVDRLRASTSGGGGAYVTASPTSTTSSGGISAIPTEEREKEEEGDKQGRIIFSSPRFLSLGSNDCDAALVWRAVPLVTAGGGESKGPSTITVFLPSFFSSEGEGHGLRLLPNSNVCIGGKTGGGDRPPCVYPSTLWRLGVL